MANPYISSYARVTIYDKVQTGEKYYLWPINLDEVGQIYPFITDVEIDVKYNAVAQITFTVNAPVKEGREMLNSSMFLSGNLVSVDVGYNSGEKETFYGHMIEGGVKLKLDSKGLSGTVSAPYISPLAFFTVSTEGMVSVGDLISGIAKQCGYSTVEYGESVERVINDRRLSQMSNVYGMSGVSGLNFILSELGMEYHVTDFLGEPGIMLELVGKKKKEINNSRTFEYMGRVDIQNEVFPIFSFVPKNLLSMFAPSGSATNTTASGINSKGKVVTVSSQAEVNSSSKGDQRVSGTEDRTVSVKKKPIIVDKKLKDGDSGKVIPAKSRATKEETQEVVVEYQQRARKEDAFEAEIETFGIPKAKVGEECKVTNTGKLYDGEFTVQGIKHRWNGSYFSVFTVKRFTAKDQKSKKK